METMELVGYIRVSTGKQARDGLSLPVQREKLELYAKLHGHALTEVVSDEGESAKDLDRPGIIRVREMLRAGQVGGLLICKLDRLTRSLGDWLDLINEHFAPKKPSARKSALVSVQDHIDTSTVTGRMMLKLIVMFAEWERELIGERTAEILQGKVADGERCGKVRYGWDLDWSGPVHMTDRGKPRLDKQGNKLPIRLQPNPAEQKVIGQMIGMRHAGMSFREIGRMLTEMGIETKEGGVWHPQTIKEIILRSEAEWASQAADRQIA